MASGVQINKQEHEGMDRNWDKDDQSFSLFSQEDSLGQTAEAGYKDTPLYLSYQREALRNTRKNGENSDKFNTVEQSLNSLVPLFNVGLPADSIPETMTEILKVVEVYKRVIIACQNYVNTRLHLTSTGRTRQKIVKDILRWMREDQAGLRSYMDRMPTLSKNDRAKNVREALGMARRRQLKLEGKRESDLKHVGGAVSYIGVIQKGDLIDKTASGYFKEEDVYQKMDTKTAVLDVVETIKKRKPIGEADYEKIKQTVQKEVRKEDDLAACFQDKVIPRLTRYWEDPLLHDFADACQAACKSGSTLSYHVHTILNIKENKVNMSKRNVATSRIAQLLGIGDVVAQSETAVLQDTSGRKITGNLMQEAEGTEGKKALFKLQRKKYDQMRADKKYEGNDTRLSMLDDTYITPEFLKSLTALQVLDNLVGQVDRHASNYMVKFDDNDRLCAVTGIDNDFSFGHRTDMGWGQNAKSIFTDNVNAESDMSKVEMAIPFMDRQLAERILAVQEDEIRLVLADLVEQGAIDAFCKRLEIVKTVLARDMSEHQERYLKKDEEWMNTLDAYKQDSKNFGGGSSYISRLLWQSTTTNEISSYVKQDMAKQVLKEELAQEKYNNINEELYAQQEKEFLMCCGVQDRTLLDKYERVGWLNGSLRIVEVKEVEDALHKEGIKRLKEKQA